MFRLDLGSTGRYCDGANRRSFLQLGVAGIDPGSQIVDATGRPVGALDDPAPIAELF